MELIKSAADILKSKLSILIGLSAALGILFFLPEAKAKNLALSPIRPYVSVSFIVLASVTAVQCFVSLSKWVMARIEKRRLLRAAKARFKRLSPEEKQILCGYLLANRRTQYFAYPDGVVQGLCHAHILYLASNAGDIHGQGFAFNIQDCSKE